VEAGIAEGDEAKRAAVPGEPIPFREAAERCDGERERKKPKRPQPGLNLELLDGIRAEVIGECATR
jgi:hypothetical protein